MARRSRRLPKKTDEKEVSLGPFLGGLDEISPESKLLAGHLREATNADFDRTGWFRRRPGQEEFAPCANGKSIFTDRAYLYWNDGTTLYRSPSTNANPTAIATLRDDYISSCIVRDDIYLTDKVNKGKVVNGGYQVNWWTPTPQGAVAATAGAGGALPPGDYFVTTTYISDATGVESGALPGVRCRVEENGKIVLANIPQLADHTTVIYVTHAGDPNIYYRHSMVLNGITEWAIAQEGNGIRLATQNMEEMPAGQIVRYHRGRLFVAGGERLYFSAGQKPGLYRAADMYLDFADRVTVVEPVTDGIYVVADKTYWIPNFSDAEFPNREMVYDGRGVEGSGLTVRGSVFPETPPGDVAYWMGERGQVLGLLGGRLNLPQERKLAPDLFARGASMYREEYGLSHVLTATQGSMKPSKAGARDSITCTVKRNGVIIPA